jgi:hypothetical protein
MKERLFSFLNIKESESRFVFDLLQVQFFIGLANALINILSFTLFVFVFSVAGLSHAFLGMAVLLLALNLIYEKLEHRFPPHQLLRLVLLFSILIFFLFWTGLIVSHVKAIIYLLLIWSTLFYMITGYAFWGLVSLLFNIRESKRVFSVVGSGDIPAKFIGYFIAPILISFIGVTNLLLAAIVFMVISVVLLNKLIHKKSWQTILKKATLHNQTHKVISHNKSKFNAFFKSDLIFSISLLSIISYNVFILVDYTFLSQVKSRYSDLAYLAAYIANFFAFGRVIALVLKLTISSRIIERMGIIACLSITPLLLFLFSLSFLFTINPDYIVFVFGIMALLTEVLRSTIQEPVFFILFQPLSEHLRLKGHIIAKGYMFPISLVIVGVSLLLFPVFGVTLTIKTTVIILLINLLVWGFVIFLIRKSYINALHSSIKKGVYSIDEIKVSDQKTINILLEKVNDGNDGEVIYALKLLEGADYKNFDSLLVNQLSMPKKELQKYALAKLDERDKIDVNLLIYLLGQEAEDEVKESIINILCQKDLAFLNTISDRLDEQDYNTRKSIIRNLLSQKEFFLLSKAVKALQALINSSSYEEKKLALDIISELNNIKFTNTLEVLLLDDNIAIKRSAIIAACKLKVAKLLPAIFELMSEPTHKYLALHGLYLYGDTLFMDIKELNESQIKNHYPDLIKIAGKCKGAYSTLFLLDQIVSSSGLNEKCIHSLWTKNFEAETPEQLKQFRNLLNSYINTAFEKISYYKEIPDHKDYLLIQQSLISEIDTDLLTTLKIASILYHITEISRVIELVENNKNKKLYNAMEMLEWMLPKRISIHINRIIDFLLDPNLNKRVNVDYDSKPLFRKILVTQSHTFSVWTKAVCMYSFIKSGHTDLLYEMGKSDPIKSNFIIKETRDYVLQAI